MRESIEEFGRQNHLYGALCVPEQEVRLTGVPCVIMLNSGLVYQAGPSRLHVEMARELAKAGYSSFRFDLSGIGDSSRSRESISYDEQIPLDIEDALSLVAEKTGIQYFVLMGICTGADNAHKYALKNEAVTGAVFLDGYAYKTAEYYLRYYGPKVINPIKVVKKIAHLLVGKPRALSRSKVNKIQEKEKEGYFWDVPPKEKTIEELRVLVDRKVAQLHVYTNDWEWCFNHLSQFKRMYRAIDFKGLATCVYFNRSNHTYTLIDERQALIKTVTDWMDSQFNTSG